MENNEQQPMTRANVEAEIDYRTAAIAEKRKGREAMIASGMTIEAEAEDVDLQEHCAALIDAETALAILQEEESDTRIAAAMQSPLPSIQ